MHKHAHVGVHLHVCMYDYHIAVSIKTLAPFEWPVRLNVCALLCLMLVCVCVCMIIISPYRLRHWLHLNDDERLYYPMKGSVGQLNLQLSVSKSTPHPPQAWGKLLH